MKKVGIVCDNWKAKAFQRALKRKGFEFTEYEFTKETTLFTIMCIEKDINLIKKMCLKLEIDLKQSN